MNTESSASSKKPSVLYKILIWSFSIIAFIVIAVYVAFQVSPWPSVLLIRHGFGGEDTSLNEKLAKYTPDGIYSKTDIVYDASYDETKLDIYFPHSAAFPGNTFPLLIWVHGGGFVAGNKSTLANYCKILASKGYVVAAIEYSVAPGEKFPVPVRQLNKAIAYLVKNAGEYYINDSCIFIAGDSGGAHTTAVLAALYTNSVYAALLGITPAVEPARLKGVILHCGPYNTALVNFEGDFGWFLKTILWAYIGKKDFKSEQTYEHFSVANYVNEEFPKTFISVGNKDPLNVHSYDLASRLSQKGVAVDSLFYPGDYSPGLPHEYQFDLDTDAGKLALDRSVKFMTNCLKK